MRYLAIDLGDKRTGLAVGDDRTGLATPLAVIATANPQERLRRIAQAVEAHEPDALVVGLPLDMSGAEGPAAARTRACAAELKRRLGLPVHLMDERLTSFAAEGQLAGSELTRKQRKGRHDALAAAVILRDFLARGTQPPRHQEHQEEG